MFFFNIIFFFQELTYNIWSIYNHGGWTVGGFFVCESVLKSTVGVVQSRTSAHIQTVLLIRKIDVVIYQEDHF